MSSKGAMWSHPPALVGLGVCVCVCVCVCVLATFSCIGSHYQYIAAELEELSLCSPLVWYPSCNVYVVSVNASILNPTASSTRAVC